MIWVLGTNVEIYVQYLDSYYLVSSFVCLGLDHSRVLLGYTNLEVFTSCMETKKQNKTKKPVFKNEKK